MFPPNPAEIWSNVSTRCENVADTTTEKHHENGVCVLFGMLRGTTSCKICTRELRGTWEGFYRSCKLPSILFSVSKAGVGVSMRVEASTSSCGSYSQTPTEPAFPDAEPSWTHGGTRCLEKGRRLSENIVQEGFKISSKSARITARDSEPERFCRDFCSLRNYVREEQDDVGPTPPGDDRRV